MEKQLSSLEIKVLCKELQCLTKGRISQIYQKEREFLFQIHTKKGKKFLLIRPGKTIHLTKNKKPFPSPPFFCSQLRKYLKQSLIKKIYQKDAERILILELEKKEKFFLIIELFAPGNIILTTSQKTILAVEQQKKFKNRLIKTKERYVFPPSVLNWFSLTKTKLKELLKKSEKKSLVTFLAVEVGLGKTYAEELCFLSEINKNKKPSEVSEKETEEIFKILQDFLKISLKPQGYLYSDEVTPFPLKEKKPLKKTNSYSEALDIFLSTPQKTPQEEKIKELKKIIEKQEKTIADLKKEIQLNQKKGEKIYEFYQPLKKLKDLVNELKKTKSWEEIKKELKKEKKIKKIDLKEKTILLDL